MPISLKQFSIPVSSRAPPRRQTSCSSRRRSNPVPPPSSREQGGKKDTWWSSPTKICAVRIDRFLALVFPAPIAHCRSTRGDTEITGVSCEESGVAGHVAGTSPGDVTDSSTTAFSVAPRVPCAMLPALHLQLTLQRRAPTPVCALFLKRNQTRPLRVENEAQPDTVTRRMPERRRRSVDERRQRAGTVKLIDDRFKYVSAVVCVCVCVYLLVYDRLVVSMKK